MRTILFAAVALAAIAIWAAPDADASPLSTSTISITPDVYIGFGYGGSHYRRRCYQRHRPVRRVRRVVYHEPYYAPRRVYYAPRRVYYARPYYPRYRSSVSIGFGHGYGHSRYRGGHGHHFRGGHGHHRGGSRRAIGRRR